MNSWLTVHLAHPDTYSIPWHVFLKNEHRFLCDEIRIGDHVFFYECKTGYDHARKGAEGIIHIAVVSGTPYERDEATLLAPEHEGEWRIGIPTDTLYVSGRVRRERLNRVMGYGLGYVFVGYNRGKGIKQLTPEQVVELLALFTRSA